MRGLMIKDMYIAYKQSKIMVLLLLFIMLIPVQYIYSYAIFVASMMPITVLSYDERSKWNRLVFMMPYSDREVVLSKYLEGYLLTGVVAVIAVCIQCVKISMYGSGNMAQMLWMALMFTCVAFILNAIVMPFMFSIGVEKGRYIWILLTVVCMVGSTNAAISMGESFGHFIMNKNGPFYLTAAVLAATVLSNLASILITGKIYTMKRK